MKLIFGSLLLLLAACNSADKKEMMSMPGAYQELSTNIKTDKIDSSSTSVKQLKIYTMDYMMYANINSPDSVSSFGIGTYTINKDTVTENVIYNAWDSTMNDKPETYILGIEKTNNGYKQVIENMTGADSTHFKLTETYETVGTSTTTPLDGAWKETRAYTITGKDTSWSNATQYKIYYAGHLIFGHTYKDSANKIHTGIGYGSFTMTGTTKSKEMITACTYYEVRGKTVDIDIAMNGTDEYTQTITNADGSKMTETYQRLRK
jgi:hypothetical protein